MNGISFVIPTYNNHTFVIDCIKSIVELKDLTNIKYEIIVVDDFSDNKIFLKLKANLENLGFKDIFISQNEKNMGPAFTRNQGVKASKFNYIFFLDSDTQILDGSITNFLQKIKDYDAVCGIYHYEPLNKGIFALHKAYLDYFYLHKNNDYFITHLQAACAGIKKNVFNSVGGYNENIKWGMDYENEELGYRIINNNYKMIISPKIIAKHHFPNGFKAIKLYFTRVSNWVLFYFNSKKILDSTGASTPFVALGCIFATMSFLSFLNIFVFKSMYSELFFLLFFAMHVLVFTRFYIFILNKTKKNFFQLFVIHFIISNTITTGALYGFFKFIKNKLIKTT